MTRTQENTQGAQPDDDLRAFGSRVALIVAVGVLVLAVLVLALLQSGTSLSAAAIGWIVAAVAAVDVAVVAWTIARMVRRTGLHGPPGTPPPSAAAGTPVAPPPGTPPPQRPSGAPAAGTLDENPHWSAVKALVTSSIVSGLVLALVVGLLIVLNKFGMGGPEEALSLVFVAAAVILILVVCTLTIVLKRLRLTNSSEAMGLPRGSIRAVIALMLILLFFVAAIFLFNTTHRVPPTPDELRTLQGLDAARLATIPTDQIQKLTPTTSNGVTTYTVSLLPSALENQTSDDLAKQLITVLGTLVTAVAAFYFGANTVGTAAKDTADRVAAATAATAATAAAAGRTR